MSQILYIKERLIITHNRKELDGFNKKIKEYLSTIITNSDNNLERIYNFKIIIDKKEFIVEEDKENNNFEIWDKFNNYESFEFYLNYSTYGKEGTKGRTFFESLLNEEYKDYVKYFNCQFLEMDEWTNLYSFPEQTKNKLTYDDLIKNGIKTMEIHYGCISLEKDETISKELYNNVVKIVKEIMNEIEYEEDEYDIEEYEEDQYQEIDFSNFEHIITIEQLKRIKQKIEEIFNLTINTEGFNITQLCLPCRIYDEYIFGKYDVYYNFEKKLTYNIDIIGT